MHHDASGEDEWPPATSSGPSTPGGYLWISGSRWATLGPPRPAGSDEKNRDPGCVGRGLVGDVDVIHPSRLAPVTGRPP